MGKAQRDKGLRGEREVKQEFEAAGFHPRGLEGQGDNLVSARSFTLHLEVKRQEQIRIDLWSHQAEEEAPPSAIPVVVYRRSREPWRASLNLSDLINLLTRLESSASVLRDPLLIQARSKE